MSVQNKVKIFSVDEGLKLLRAFILEMGNLVKESHEVLISSLKERNLKSLGLKASQNEKKINNLHIKIDDLCWKILARQSPVAIDLREILAGIKVNGDLERIGDQIVNIYKNVKLHLHLKKIKWPKYFFEMLEATKEILYLSLEALQLNDVKLAKKVFKKDLKINDYQNTMIRTLIEKMKSTLNSIDDIVTLILIARSLERIGDLSKNIAEDVIFISSGKDVRHNRHTDYK